MCERDGLGGICLRKNTVYVVLRVAETFNAMV
jgi:hypothetical protein